MMPQSPSEIVNQVLFCQSPRLLPVVPRLDSSCGWIEIESLHSQFERVISAIMPGSVKVKMASFTVIKINFCIQKTSLVNIPQWTFKYVSHGSNYAGTAA